MPSRGRPAAPADVAEERVVERHLAVGYTDDPDGRAGPGDGGGGLDGLAAVPTHSSAASTPMPSVSCKHGLLGLVAAFLDDVGGAELRGELSGDRRGG